MFKFGLPQVMFDADNGGNGGSVDGKVENNENVKPEGTETGDTNQEGNGAESKDTAKPLTLEDVQKMIQSETDRVRGEYSKKLKDKEKQLEDLRMSTMTEEERIAEEQKQLQDNLSQREAELKHKELTLDTIDLLKENDLPLETRNFLIGKDIESTKKNVESFKKMFSSALEEAVTERFKKSGKEHTTSSGKGTRYTQEDLARMSSDEINANWDKIQRDLSV